MSTASEIVPGVTAASTASVKGLWVSEDRKTIGLVEQKCLGLGPYLVIWKENMGHGLPLAISADGVQLPTSDHSQKFIDWETLFEMVEAFKASKAPTEA